MNLNPLRRSKPDDEALPPYLGDIPTAKVPRPRPDPVAKAVETGLAELEQLRHDRDAAEQRTKDALEMCSKAADKIRRLQEEVADLKSRITIYQIERDGAVARHGKLQGFLASLFAQMKGFEVPEPSAPAPNLPEPKNA